MKKMKPIVWELQTTRFSHGKNALIGKVKVGSVHFNGIDRDENLRYVANCTLPNVKNGGLIGKYPSEQKAIDEV